MVTVSQQLTSSACNGSMQKKEVLGVTEKAVVDVKAVTAGDICCPTPVQNFFLA